MRSGLRRPTYDRRDYDLHKTFGATLPAQFPLEYNVDPGLWNPNQNNANAPDGLEVIPALPYGCTDYTQTDLCIDEDGKLYSPMLLENATRANARGGIDIRESLDAARKVFSRTAYFRITAQAPLDMFDAVRLAMLSTASEKRAVSAGTPFFPEWEQGEILQTPNFDLSRATWHNWKIAGWTTINGVPYLKCKMWTGDWKYMSRELCNAVFAIRGSVAYTLSKVAPQQIQTVDFQFVQWVVSFFQSLFNPPPPPAIIIIDHSADAVPTVPPAPTYLWDTKEHLIHSLRVIADEEGLSPLQKNLLCDICRCESEYNIHAKLINSSRSIDRGLFQWNNYYHPEITDAIAYDPEKATRLACKAILQKKAMLYWSASSHCWNNHRQYDAVL